MCVSFVSLCVLCVGILRCVGGARNIFQFTVTWRFIIICFWGPPARTVARPLRATPRTRGPPYTPRDSIKVKAVCTSRRYTYSLFGERGLIENNEPTAEQAHTTRRYL